MTSRQYHSKDGTLVYDVQFHILDEEHTDIWIVALDDDQAARIRAALQTLQDEGFVGYAKCGVRTVDVDNLDALGVRLRDLLPKGRRNKEAE